MNSSIYSADRATHWRIVAVAMAVSLAIIGVLLSLPSFTDHAPKVVNAGQLHKAVAARQAAAVHWLRL